MTKQLKHRASISTVYWDNIREEVSRVNADFAKIIDQLDPSKKFPLFKAKYPFGAKIAHEGNLYLPTETGDVCPINANNANIATSITSQLSRCDLPAILMLKNTAEMFYEMPDRVISGYVLRPGNFIGLWEQLDPPGVNYAKWVWSLVSGARTLYLLPKITNVTGHKSLRKKYGVTSHIPKDYPEQWNIFVEIANSQEFKQEWHSEMLIFPDIWFDMASKDPAWKGFYNFLMQKAWKDSRYWRYRNIFELVWENFIYEVMDKNIKPNLYLAYIVKQLILIGAEVLPGLTVAIDENSAPIKALQEVYIEDYKLKNYNPIFMKPHNFTLSDKTPTYYSLQYPNLLETIPIIQTLPSILSSIPEIQILLKAFKDKTAKSYIVKNTPIDKFCNDVTLDYFHYREEKFNGIQSTEKMPQEDERLLIYPEKSKNNVFPSTSNLINGCVRFQNKNTT